MTTFNSFDISSILGIGNSSSEPLPEGGLGVFVLRIPEGLTLQSLRDMLVEKKLIDPQHWFDGYAWSQQAIPPGIHRVCCTVRGTAADRPEFLAPNECMASVTLVALFLLCLHSKGSNSLENTFFGCSETIDDDHHVQLEADRLVFSGSSPKRVVIFWHEGRLHISTYRDDVAYNNIAFCWSLT